MRKGREVTVGGKLIGITNEEVKAIVWWCRSYGYKKKYIIWHNDLKAKAYEKDIKDIDTAILLFGECDINVKALHNNLCNEIGWEHLYFIGARSKFFRDRQKIVVWLYNKYIESRANYKND